MIQGYFSYHKEEQENKIKSFVSSISFLLLLLLTIYFFKFDIKMPEDPNAPPYVSLIDFIPKEEVKAYEDAGGSKGGDDVEDKEGGSTGNQQQTPQPEPEPEADTKVDNKPVETIPTKTSTPPVVTQAEPDAVKLPTPPPVKVVPKPSTDVVTTTTPTRETPTKPSSTTTSSSEGDDDHPGTGGSGTGSGSGNGSGASNSGSGNGTGGNGGTGNGTGSGGGSGSGTGSGDGVGVGVDLETTGPLKRRVATRPDLKDIAGTTAQSVAFNLCINRDGQITDIKYNSKLSATKDLNFVRRALAKMRQYTFEVNKAAPTKECGVFKFNVAGVIQKLQ